MTRSSHQPDHLVHTPDTFVRAPLPGMNSATAVVHAAPAIGAKFTMYTVELDSGGFFDTGESQTFLYVLDGEIVVGIDRQRFARSGFVYRPLYSGVRVRAADTARVAVIEKPFVPLDNSEPTAFFGSEEETAAAPLFDDKAIEVRKLVPDRFEFDFAVNSLTFAPDARLPAVQMSVMEHGLLLLEGEGVWRLGDRSYNVMAGDFIWTAPFCPQWFGATGKTPAKYLMYTDWNRHP